MKTNMDIAIEAATNSVIVKEIGTHGLADQIPTWILDKNGIAVRGNGFEIERETEKAVLVNTHSSMFGGTDKTFWVPKSQLKDAEAVKAETIEYEARKQVSMRYTAYLAALATENNVEMTGWERTAYALSKKGIEVMSRDAFAAAAA